MDNEPGVMVSGAHIPDEQEKAEENARRRRSRPQELPEDYAQWLDQRVFDEDEEAGQ